MKFFLDFVEVIAKTTNSKINKTKWIYLSTKQIKIIEYEDTHTHKHTLSLSHWERKYNFRKLINQHWQWNNSELIFNTFNCQYLYETNKCFKHWLNIIAFTLCKGINQQIKITNTVICNFTGKVNWNVICNWTINFYH